MASKLTVVLSQGQSNNPAKRNLEESIASALLFEPGVEVSIVPHLYDLAEGHSGLLFLRAVQGDMVVISWMFPRAAHWTLDSRNVKGWQGSVLLRTPDQDESDEDAAEAGDGTRDSQDSDESADGKSYLGGVDVPRRHIWCIGLQGHESPDAIIAEVRRIAQETHVETVSLNLDAPRGNGQQKPAAQTDRPASVPDQSPSDLGSWIQGSPSPEQLARYSEPAKYLESTGRRWNPVIDYDRCTNCMECIDFCLFGVYGVDNLDRILVENPDNCKKGCPACSRVCPEHAIIFPMHKTPEIAGAPGDAVGGLKIDLSKLFGGADALSIAARERDVELVRDGREAVGLAVGIPKRRGSQPQPPKDELDGLIDQLDELDI